MENMISRRGILGTTALAAPVFPGAMQRVLAAATAATPSPAIPVIDTHIHLYRPRLDEILDVFGIDRVLYGSDWPNSDQWLPLPVGFKIVQEYFLGKGRPAAEKYFWRNSVKCYKWVKRTASQPQLT